MRHGRALFCALIVADIGAPIGCALALSDIRNTIGQSCAPSDAPLASFESRQSRIGERIGINRPNYPMGERAIGFDESNQTNPNQRTDSDLC